MEYDFSKLSEEEIIKLIRGYDLCLNDIPEEYRTEAICLEAVKSYSYAIQYIDKPSIKIKLEAVKQNGFIIKYIPNPTYEMQLLAVKSNGMAIEYIPNPSLEVQLEAVKSNGFALELIKEQTIELCVEAIKCISCAIEYVSHNLLDKVLEEFPNIKLFKCKNRLLISEKVNNEWLFSIGCQIRITKEEFIHRIYNYGYGLENNPHRHEYLKILEQF